MRQAILYTLFLIPHLTFSQALEVHYDVQSGEVKFYENSTEVLSPLVKKGQPIVLHIENYNNYIYEVDIQETQQEYQLGEGNNPLAGMEGLAVQNLLNLPTDSDADGVIDMMDEEPDILIDFESEQEQQIYLLRLEAEASLSSLENIEAGFERMAKEVKTFERQVKFAANSLSEVDKLKMNPHLPPQKIKGFSTNIMEKALHIEGYQEPSLEVVIEENNHSEKLSGMISSVENRKENYVKEVGKIGRVKTELLRLAPGQADLATLYFSMENAILTAPETLAEADNISNEIGGLLETEENKDLHETLAIWYEYEAIKANDFSKTHRTQARKDVVVFDVNLNRKPVAENSGADANIQLSPIKIPVHGGLKINASVGINFGQYFSPIKSYFVRDSVIVGQNDDSFLPMITSNLHVYSQSRHIVSVGGTMGIGIPLGSDDGFQSINFFLGPSLFFGQSERLVLNMGIMGGKARRLSSGYEEGDFFDGETVFLPYHTPYELGYFMGLSFNLR